MITRKQAFDLLDGCALLEVYGNLYEFCGTYQGQFLFQCVSDDQSILTSYENLIKRDDFYIQY